MLTLEWVVAVHRTIEGVAEQLGAGAAFGVVDQVLDPHQLSCKAPSRAR